MKNLFAAIVWTGVTCMSAMLSSGEAAERHNVLVISIDDLNDWAGYLGGHPQAQTPHIDRLAARGMLFANAHVQATYCGPSRVSFLSGRYPETTGCYDFEKYSELESLQNHPPLQIRPVVRSTARLRRSANKTRGSAQALRFVEPLGLAVTKH